MKTLKEVQLWYYKAKYLNSILEMKDEKDTTPEKVLREFYSYITEEHLDDFKLISVSAPEEMRINNFSLEYLSKVKLNETPNFDKMYIELCEIINETIYLIQFNKISKQYISSNPNAINIF